MIRPRSIAAPLLIALVVGTAGVGQAIRIQAAEDRRDR